MKYNLVIIKSFVIFFLFSISTNAMKRERFEGPGSTGFTENFSAGIYNISDTVDDEAAMSNSIIVDADSSSMFSPIIEDTNSPTSERKKLLKAFINLNLENFYSLYNLLESASKEQVKVGQDLEESINFVFTVLPSYTNHLISLMEKKQNNGNECVDDFSENHFYIYGSDLDFHNKIENKFAMFWNILARCHMSESGAKERLFRWTDLYLAGLQKPNSTKSLLVKKTLKKFIELHLSGKTFEKFKDRAYDILVAICDRNF